MTPTDVQPGEGESARAARPGKRQGELVRQIRNQFEVRNKLIDCNDLGELADKGLGLVREKLKTQTASLFLFDKSGYLKRIGIRGIDKKGQAISDTWYPDESYHPGESFTGKAISPIGDSQYGEPQWTNNLRKEPANPKSVKAYTNLLGFLRCAICVPLNGRHRTFGALEVVNKLDGAGWPNGKHAFGLDDVYWLSIIGMSMASAITSLRRQAELDHLADVSTRLQEPFGDRFDAGRTYTAMAERLVSAKSPYSACIIRIDEGGKLKVVGRASDGIPWEGATTIGSCTEMGEGLAGKVCQSGELVDYVDVEDHAEEFTHAGWVRRNGLRSYTCIPLKIQDRVVGTLSLFTRYKHRLYDTDKTFLLHIAAQIASVAESSRVVDKLRETTAAVSSGAETGKHDALVAGYSGGVASYVHKYKNDLLNFRQGFEEMIESKTVRRTSIARKHIQQIDLLLQEISRDISERQTRVNVNRLVQDTVQYYQMDPKSSDIRYFKHLDDGLPDLEVRQGDMRTIIDNLLSNAVKAVRKAGRQEGIITVSTARVQMKEIEYLELTVEDNGIGIKNEDKDKVCIRGYTTYPGGTGEGLFLTKRLVENALGGSIEFRSTVGKGTVFSVRIPLLRNLWQEEAHEHAST